MTDVKHRLSLPLVLCHLTRLAAFAMPLVAAGIWLFWDDLAPLAQTGLDVTAMGPGARAAGFALALGAALLHAYGLLGLSQTFAEGAAGRALSAKSVAGFRRFAWIALLLVPIRVALYSANVMLVTMSDSVPGTQLAIKLGTPEISAFFTALLLVFTAQVFAQGHALQQENEAFI